MFSNASYKSQLYLYLLLISLIASPVMLAYANPGAPGIIPPRFFELIPLLLEVCIVAFFFWELGYAAHKIVFSWLFITYGTYIVFIVLMSLATSLIGFIVLELFIVGIEALILVKLSAKPSYQWRNTVPLSISMALFISFVANLGSQVTFMGLWQFADRQGAVTQTFSNVADQL